MKFFNARKDSYHTNPILIDEAIYTPYAYDPQPSNPNPTHHTSHPTGDLLGIPELIGEGGGEERKKKKKSKFDATSTEAEIFLFDYGTVVIWGMTEAQEKRFLSSMYVSLSLFFLSIRWQIGTGLYRKRFEIEKLPQESVEMEDLNFYYANYSRIYNDVITLRRKSSYM